MLYHFHPILTFFSHYEPLKCLSTWARCQEKNSFICKKMRILRIDFNILYLFD